ncbi:MAG: hypothetical protein DRI99_04115 [Candidatus Aminicenantes bacterium]|nr:hypothetical protein [Candidatus Aminicenantes bacterium]RLE02368.1 MAG: hypothetical protein DRJ11_07340 [Candidatus Aminicenantes bacterium]RLE04213.1 MAG: hypothetical protein DRI99_04115 [Candidatus Aminicenantes bacterium]HHF42917.1 hypothetical protein [Candidatus Aminicenantes bacterium]
MKTKSDQKKLISVNCPICHSILWIDPVLGEVIKVEKGKRPKSSLDDLLLKEKEKKEKADLRFEATAKMAREKRRKIEEEFEKFLKTLDKED